ncbi:MAG: caspase family protein [Planctomycetaceae bacterium]
MLSPPSRFNAMPGDSTLAIIIGGSTYPGLPRLNEHPDCSARIARSKDAFHRYLLNCWGIAPSHVKDLFDSLLSPGDLLVEVKRFLEQPRIENSPVTDLVLYFVGHGQAIDQDYYFVVPFTLDNLIPGTALSAVNLSQTLAEHARGLRTYLILDACFSASAQRCWEVPSVGFSRLADNKTPTSGVAILSSSDRDQLSRAEDGPGGMTYFTGFLLEVLNDLHCDDANGVPDRQFASLREVTNLVRERLLQREGSAAVFPQVHSPDARRGDIADVPLFPLKRSTRQCEPIFGATPAESREHHATASRSTIQWERTDTGDSVRPRNMHLNERWRTLGLGALLLAGLGIGLAVSIPSCRSGSEVTPRVNIDAEGDSPVSSSDEHVVVQVYGHCTEAEQPNVDGVPRSDWKLYLLVRSLNETPWHVQSEIPLQGDWTAQAFLGGRGEYSAANGELFNVVAIRSKKRLEGELNDYSGLLTNGEVVLVSGPKTMVVKRP